MRLTQTVLKKNMKNLWKNNKSILKQQRFISEGHNAYNEIINNITLSPNDDKRIQSIDSVETYTYRTHIDLINEKEKSQI